MTRISTTHHAALIQRAAMSRLSDLSQLQPLRPAADAPREGTTLGPAATLAPEVSRAVDEAPVRAGLTPLHTQLAMEAALSSLLPHLGSLFGGDAVAEVPDAEVGELTTPPPSEVALGDQTFTDVTQTTADDGALRTTGVLDLSDQGLGRQTFELTLDEFGEVTGARSEAETVSLDVGGHGLFLRADEGAALLEIDAEGALTASGRAEVELLGQVRELGSASVTFRETADGRAVDISAQFESDDRPVDVDITVEEGGLLTADVGLETAEEWAPFLDTMSGFLEQIGVSVETEATVGVEVDARTGNYALSVAGMDFSVDTTEKVVSVGGIGFGAGVSLTVDELTFDLDDGRFSGAIDIGVGVGAGGVGVGFDFAGFDFSYDPGTGWGSLGGTLGTAFAGVAASADFQLTDDGIAVSNLQFEATLDADALADAAAAALSDAAALGREKFDAFRGQAEAAFDQGLREPFLNAAAGMGEAFESFIDAGARVGEELEGFLEQANALAGEDLARFLTVTASAVDPDAYVRQFVETRAQLEQMLHYFARVRVDREGRWSAAFDVPGGSRSDLVFLLEAGRLTGRGRLRLGGFDFGQARFEFGSRGLESVDAKATLRWRGTGVDFQTRMSGGRVEATGRAGIRMFGRTVGVGLTVGSGGIRVS